MSNQIRMTPDNMRERARDYENEAEKVHDVIVKMDQLLVQLQSEWEGSAAESYASRYEELKPGFVKAEELINEIADSLKNSARLLEETDAEIANQYK